MDALGTLIAAGASMAAPTKMLVDTVKRYAPDLPPWALLLCAFGFGEALVFLVSLYVALPMTSANIAGCVITGAAAALGAVATTELHKAARPEPALLDVLPELTKAAAHDIVARVRSELDAMAAPSVTITAGSASITRRGTPEQTEPLMPRPAPTRTDALRSKPSGPDQVVNVDTQPAAPVLPVGRLSPEHLAQITTDLERRMRATPADPGALISKPPTWVPAGMGSGISQMATATGMPREQPDERTGG